MHLKIPLSKLGCEIGSSSARLLRLSSSLLCEIDATNGFLTSSSFWWMLFQLLVPELTPVSLLESKWMEFKSIRNNTSFTQPPTVWEKFSCLLLSLLSFCLCCEGGVALWMVCSIPINDLCHISSLHRPSRNHCRDRGTSERAQGETGGSSRDGGIWTAEGFQSHSSFEGGTWRVQICFEMVKSRILSVIFSLQCFCFWGVLFVEGEIKWGDRFFFFYFTHGIIHSFPRF